MQADFLVAILRSLKETSLHTAIETCGHFKEEILDDLLESADLVLFDIKHADPETHRKFTGVSNEKILSNFSQILARAGSDRIIPRIPVIPGFNDDTESIDMILATLNRLGYSGPVHLMPYNRMAKTKWEKIGRGSSYKDMGDLSDDTLDRIASAIEYASFEPVCNI